ncbi:hypothetical protein PACID_19230 [Acidipropionibacterium acidipropionici ATCC 4875]|uniref:Uncharacterized protein n=1 Tax=Acidipropionibacterium acidipropionici (strain ATCC 4875 / DSM 20272 / JCM 6432 / NBRC 12425 / NCIMB 8070 / 4) TaxID=1171373 RepID=K7S521_ACIA4|nr:hypothetical protein PACID_19230 [Acidipropionibacterium acidipropionici ATCC 4875]
MSHGVILPPRRPPRGGPCPDPRTGFAAPACSRPLEALLELRPCQLSRSIVPEQSTCQV